MGFYFERHPERSALEVLRFKCHCGHTEALRVKVRRPSGDLYETEFAKCAACQAMYHCQGDLYQIRAYIPEPPARATRFGGSKPNELVPQVPPAPLPVSEAPAVDHS